ncbi:haloacid dehalogenase type II [Cryobacterium algoritolerans]|uniref:Haloacid dehalogenase type II n=1 Tax=Cryobacterium algoritolerans TaxID=1259184 RepID=A0A4R8WVY5_9MICO|nr:haloacid dehalogenase type II [Cryobacterium algoritolerans]TFC18936.1 haloacid dehalogenase type II [Cryobacterium algoritolerans]
MTNRTPSVIVFDVNETLSDMSPLKARFVAVGAPAHLARTWFAALLRDGFALAAAGGTTKFSVIGSHLLREMLRDVTLTRSLDDAVNHIMDGFAALNLHPDIPDGIRALKRAGVRLVTLSNGSAEVARTLLTRAELVNEFEALLTVEDAPAWKPVRSAYHYAADACGVQPADILLIAVHPWDIHGAAQAGLRTGWLNRTNATYPRYFAAPDYTASTLSELAIQLGHDGGSAAHED